MRALSLSRAWDETKAIISRDGRLFVSVALALVVLPQTILLVVGVPVGSQATLISEAVYVAAVLIGFAAQIALNRLAIGPSTTVGASIGRGFARLLPLVGALALLVIALLAVLLVIAFALARAGRVAPPGAGQTPPPSIIVLMLLLVLLSFAVFQLSIPVAAVESGGPIRLFVRSWQLARGEYPRLLAFVVTVFVGIVVVALAGRSIFGSLVILLFGEPNPGTLSALVLGIIGGTIQACFTIASAVMLARIYVQLAGRGGAEASVPTTGI